MDSKAAACDLPIGSLRGARLQQPGIPRQRYGDRPAIDKINDQQLIVDITDIVAGYLGNPSSNHGIVVGSLTGAQDGSFTLQTGAIASGVAARITYHYDSRILNQ